MSYIRDEFIARMFQPLIADRINQLVELNMTIEEFGDDDITDYWLQVWEDGADESAIEFMATDDILYLTLLSTFVEITTEWV